MYNVIFQFNPQTWFYFSFISLVLFSFALSMVIGYSSSNYRKKYTNKQKKVMHLKRKIYIFLYKYSFIHFRNNLWVYEYGNHRPHLKQKIPKPSIGHQKMNYQRNLTCSKGNSSLKRWITESDSLIRFSFGNSFF